MKITTIIARSLLGLVFVVFGSNKFLHFMPMPPMTGEAGAFMGAMFVTHYLYVVAAFEVIGGLLLLTGRYGPLGLTLVGPVVVNILAFHTFMAPSGLPVATVVAALALFLLWSYREHFAGLVKPVQAQRRDVVGQNSRTQPVAARS
ncbi:MAG TPA: DoxX family protein [Candidatus Sulfotelmatobacter sp.]|nr:DoxX family protein [Candidatus Sulfotelmatobacter sp.]